MIWGGGIGQKRGKKTQRLLAREKKTQTQQPGRKKNYYFLETASQNLFFPGEGPLKLFFLISSGPTPRSLMVVP